MFIIDDSDAAITYTGNWTTLASVGAITNEYNSTVHKSGAAGDRVSYSFNGTRIGVWGTLDSPTTKGPPSATFSVDGQTPTAFNATGGIIVDRPDLAISHILLYLSPIMPQGPHNISITTATQSDHTAGPFYFDFFTVVTGSTSATGNVIIDDRDLGIAYNGSWFDTGIGAAFAGTTSESPSDGDGGSAMYRFYGTAITVYGSTAASTGASTVASMDFFIDGLKKDTFNGPLNAPETLHTPFFHISGLSNDLEHTMVMKTLNANPCFLDYLVYTVEKPVVSDGDGGMGGGDHGGGSSPNVGLIAGLIGGIAGVLAVLMIILLLLRRRQLRKEANLDGEKAQYGADSPEPFLVPFINPEGYSDGDPTHVSQDALPVSSGTGGVIPPSKGRGPTHLPTSESYLSGSTASPSACSSAPQVGGQDIDIKDLAYGGIEPVESPPARRPEYRNHQTNDGSLSAIQAQDSGIRIPTMAPPMYTPD